MATLCRIASAKPLSSMCQVAREGGTHWADLAVAIYRTRERVAPAVEEEKRRGGRGPGFDNLPSERNTTHPFPFLPSAPCDTDFGDRADFRISFLRRTLLIPQAIAAPQPLTTIAP